MKRIPAREPAHDRHIFSNGTEAMDWQANNCHQCKRYRETYDSFELPGTMTPAKQIEILETILRERNDASSN